MFGVLPILANQVMPIMFCSKLVSESFQIKRSYYAGSPNFSKKMEKRVGLRQLKVVIIGKGVEKELVSDQLPYVDHCRR